MRFYAHQVFDIMYMNQEMQSRLIYYQVHMTTRLGVCSCHILLYGVLGECYVYTLFCQWLMLLSRSYHWILGVCRRCYWEFLRQIFREDFNISYKRSKIPRPTRSWVESILGRILIYRINVLRFQGPLSTMVV